MRIHRPQTRTNLGLYVPETEKGCCGVGLVVNIDGLKSYKVLEDARTMLLRMAHRGATVKDTGDGAGVMTAIPDKLYRERLSSGYAITLPPFGKYATGMVFIDSRDVLHVKSSFENIAKEMDLSVICWRDVPLNHDAIGPAARSSKPHIIQVFVTALDSCVDLGKQLFMLRKNSTNRILKEVDRFYICSLSDNVMVYKGRFDAAQLWNFYTDLKDENYLTHFAIVHARFATNTFPTWELAQPFRVLAHNGEINTLRGNCNHMRSREGLITSTRYGINIAKVYPILENTHSEASDTSLLDNAVEFLVAAGTRSLPESLACLIPEAWETAPESAYRDFLKCSSFATEPWDGPAAVMFADGRYCGAILDRNGLRPSRFCLSDDRFLYVASETGVVECNAVHKGRLGPGHMILADTLLGKLYYNEEAKKSFTRPVKEWLDEIITMNDITGEVQKHLIAGSDYCGDFCITTAQKFDEFKEADRRLVLFGYNTESFNEILLPMIRDKKEATGSMGDDAPLACLSHCNPLIYDYFQQNFAQGTNPSMDSIRERVVMSVACPVGPEHNLLEPAKEQCQRLWLEWPILCLREMEVIKLTHYRNLKAKVINMIYPVNLGRKGLRVSLKNICKQCSDAVRCGFTLLVLSDRCVGPAFVPISPLLVVGAVHQRLTNQHLRAKCAIFVESGEIRDIHHFAVLLGYRSLGVLDKQVSEEALFERYRFTCVNGIYHVMAKMGISTLQSYKGAQIFEAVGISSDVIDECFNGTTSRIGGVSFEILADEVLHRHTLAYSDRICDIKFAQNYGFFNWRAGGEYHLQDPRAIRLLQTAVFNADAKSYQEFSKLRNELSRHCTLSGQFDFKFSPEPVPLNEVESKEAIMKRFSAAAISFGSVSLEAHRTIAQAMSALGSYSNCGEGGEPEGGISSAIKQNKYYNSLQFVKLCNSRSQLNVIRVEFGERCGLIIASGRFGVDINYIAQAKELQIKMGQGSKPGEGGELPWYKMDDFVAKTRNSTPWIGDISPAPHHDVYSVEDLSQLVYDLKSANPCARISLKLVSAVGVGVVTTGAVKSGVNAVTISGHGGGTGGSNRTGLKNAGMPWELGIAEANQVLVMNRIRNKVSLEVDGQMQSGIDVVKAALLGADKFSFGTGILISMGCTMSRKCHLNTCHVGIATQDPSLQKRFKGKSQYIMNYFNFIAEEVRVIMSKLGMRVFDELIGRTDLLCLRKDVDHKTRLLDFRHLLYLPETSICQFEESFVKFQLNEKLEYPLIDPIVKYLRGERTEKLFFEMKITNSDRAFGTTISHYVTRFGNDLKLDSEINPLIKMTVGRLPPFLVTVTCSAGQSFGAYLSAGLFLTLEGDANDFVGKGLSGGIIVVHPPNNKSYLSEKNTIAGNVLLYGATKGEAYFRGQVGERFCVRNSGAISVCEGCGDHGCEYMTGGIAVILGEIGRNFAAGMAGGVAYVYDIMMNSKAHCNLANVHLCDVESSESELKNVLKCFHEYTDSSVAAYVLENWEDECQKFFKVIPHDSERHLHRSRSLLSQTSSKSSSVNCLNVKENQLLQHEDANFELVPDLEDLAVEKYRGFMLYEREKQSYRQVKERIFDKEEIVNFSVLKRTVEVQAARCINCGVPFCQSNYGCPVGCVISDFNKLVTENDWRSALQRILQSNNFPEFTGRVCPAFCEKACVLQPDAVTIRNVELVITEHGFYNGWIVPEIPVHRTGFRIAIVGSGPSGLAAAAQLNKAGHHVTVYERENQIGGLLRYGIPSTRLNKQTIDRRIHLLQQEGITFLVNYEITGTDISEFLKSYDAVLLAVGCSLPTDLVVKGRSSSNIYLASSFLSQWWAGAESLHIDGKDVIVIGKAEFTTTADCISALVRENARSITCILLVSAKDSSGRSPELDIACEEATVACKLKSVITSAEIKEFIADDSNQVASVRYLPVNSVSKNDGDGDASENVKTADCDIVLISLGVKMSKHDSVQVLCPGVTFDDKPLSRKVTTETTTNQKKLFICGDCRIGSSAVVHAISEGRQAARKIDLFLMNQSQLAGAGGIVSDISSFEFQ